MQDGSDPNMPGQVIQPGGTVQPSATPPVITSPVQAPTPPEPVSLPTESPVAPEQVPDNINDTEEFLPDIGEVSWSASEFIAHEKNASWYLVLGVAAVSFAAVIFLLSHDKISTAMVIIIAAIFGFSASHKPRTLQYVVNDRGIGIGAKFYGYELFKSFSVMQDGAFSSIVLMPLKRFSPSISMYYPPENEEEIADVLSNYLPHEERKQDPLDNFMRKVRF